jgi:serine-type D-Ala-D-Ala carboxypeptidase/endopeptidase
MDMKTKIVLVVTAAAALMACGFRLAFAQEKPVVDPTILPTPLIASVEQIQTIIDERIRQRANKGIAVALILPNGEVRFAGAGDSGNAVRPKVDEDTIFEIGSISKTFTATLLAQMVERGEVKLNDPLREFAPAGLKMISPGVGDVTLEQLATHTSGMQRLPPHWDSMKWLVFDLRNPYAHYTREVLWANAAVESLELGKKHKPVYSNYGVGLLGDALGNRAKSTWQQLVRERIAVPLKMNDTSDVTSPEAASRLAFGTTDNFNRARHWDFASMGAAGALRSTARDMTAFIRAQRDGTLAGARMTHEVRAAMSEHNSIGLVWVVTKRHDDEVVWHNGGTGGFRSFAGFSKKSGIGVVVLSNTSTSVDDIGRHLINPKFNLAKEGRSVNWLVIGVAGFIVFWISAVGWLGGVGPQTPSGRSTKEIKWWHAEYWDIGPRRMQTKVDLLWWLVSLPFAMWLVHVWGPWEWIGEIGRVLAWLAMLSGVAAFVWRARKLPWRAPASAPEGGGRVSRLFSRAGSFLWRGVMLFLLALIVWNVLQP